MKYVQVYLSPNNGQEVQQDVATNDDNVTRHLKGIFTSSTTNLLDTRVYKTGQKIAEFSNGILARLNDFVELAEDYPAGISFHVGLYNNTGGNLANVAVVLAYET